MRTTMITVRSKIVNVAKPWLPWIAPVGLGATDALNLIEASLFLYLGLLAGAVTITTSALVCRRDDRAQITRAMMYGYQLGLEHRDEIQAAERPIAVGENITMAIPRRLQAVQPPTVSTAGQVYHSEAAAATSVSMPSQATRPRLASARPPQPQP